MQTNPELSYVDPEYLDTLPAPELTEPEEPSASTQAVASHMYHTIVSCITDTEHILIAVLLYVAPARLGKPKPTPETVAIKLDLDIFKVRAAIPVINRAIRAYTKAHGGIKSDGNFHPKA